MAPNSKWSLPTEGKPIKDSPPTSPYTSPVFNPSAVSKGKETIHQRDDTVECSSLGIAEPQTAFLLPSQDPYAGVGVDVIEEGSDFGPYYTVSGGAVAAGEEEMDYSVGGLSLPMQHVLNPVADGFELSSETSGAAAKFVYMSERAMERRKQRMIKNRESAARSRARRLAYDSQLAVEIKTLKKANEKLEKELVSTLTAFSF